MLSKFRIFLLKVLKPILRQVAKLYMPYSRKRFNGEDYYKVRDYITPGCAILTTTRGEATNLFNSSDPKHGGLYVGGETVKYVVEALGRGVVKTDLVSFLTSKDIVVILKPKNLNNDQMLNAADFAAMLEGCGYDYEFESDDEEYYCFELIATAYEKTASNFKVSSSEVWGVKTYRAQDILEDTDNWEVIYDNRG